MGDNLEFVNILDIYYESIYSYNYRLLENIHEAQDITQEVFIKLHKNLYKYDPNKASLKTWLYKLATNEIINYKKKKKMLFHDNVNFIASDEDIILKLIKEERNRLVVDCIYANLNKKHKKIILMYIFSELTPKEISRGMNIPLKTVYNSIRVSVEKIKKILEV